MKRTLLIYGFIVTINSNLSAQTVQKELTLEQDVEVTLPNGKATTNKVTFYIKEGKVKSHSIQNGGEMNIYYFDSTKVMNTVVNISGQTQKNEMPDAINNVNNKFDEIVVDYSNQTKKISNISCKKAVITLKKGEDTEIKNVWYDPNTVLSFKYNFGVEGLELIKGLPIQYENIVMGIKMLHTVNDVNILSPISNEIFNF